MSEDYLLLESYTFQENRIGISRRRERILVELIARAPCRVIRSRLGITCRTMPADPLHIWTRASLQMLFVSRRKTRRADEIFRRHILFPSAPPIKLRELVLPLEINGRGFARALVISRSRRFRSARNPARNLLVTRLHARGRNEINGRGFILAPLS